MEHFLAVMTLPDAVFKPVVVALLVLLHFDLKRVGRDVEKHEARLTKLEGKKA